MYDPDRFSSVYDLVESDGNAPTSGFLSGLQSSLDFEFMAVRKIHEQQTATVPCPSSDPSSDPTSVPNSQGDTPRSTSGLESITDTSSSTLEGTDNTAIAPKTEEYGSNHPDLAKRLADYGETFASLTDKHRTFCTELDSALDQWHQPESKLSELPKVSATQLGGAWAVYGAGSYLRSAAYRITDAYDDCSKAHGDLDPTLRSAEDEGDEAFRHAEQSYLEAHNQAREAINKFRQSMSTLDEMLDVDDSDNSGPTVGAGSTKVCPETDGGALELDEPQSHQNSIIATEPYETTSSEMQRDSGGTLIPSK